MALQQPRRKKTLATSEFKIKQFAPTTIPDNAVCFVIGRRGSGKTTLVTFLAWLKKHLPYGVACSATEHANKYWGFHIPAQYIHKTYDESITNNLIAFQNRQSAVYGKDNFSPAFELLDDIMYDQSFPRMQSTRELFMNGRHYRIFVLLTAQYCMDLPPALRTNVDYVFILKEPIRANRVKLYNNFAGIFPTFQHFNNALDKCTSNYGCMVIDNTSTSNNIEDVVSHFRAPKTMSSFKMGSKKYWSAR